MSGPHVIVQLSASKRLRISVTPSTTLSNVLEQACGKFGLDAENFALKSGKNTVDLSLPFRLSKLTSGAKIDLIRCDRARGSSTVSVALQLVDGDGSRLIDKFPSSTTVWEVLKAFEASSTGRRLNFTERANPKTAGSGGGAGRLYYEMPVVQIMQREVLSLEDHQKSLSSLGISSGTVLLKLKFVPTEIPLEDAMAQIGSFSANNPSTSQPKAAPEAKGDTVVEAGTSEAPMETVETAPQESTIRSTKPPALEPDNQDTQSEQRSTELIKPTETIAGPDDRQISVFSAASGNTPEAAKLQVDESHYEMTVKQARQYQDQLKTATFNKRLLTEAQQKQKADAELNRRKSVRQVQIRIRFTDGTAVQSTFKQEDTAETLYHFVQGLLQHPQEPFHLTLPGPQQVPVQRNASSLIVDLGILIPTIINFNWDSTASSTAKSSPVLADQFRNQAIQMPVPKEPDAIEVEDDDTPRRPKQSTSSDASASGSGGGTGGKVPKWLKFGRK